MSASAEDEEIGPSIDSADPEERIAARRLRITKRLEQLRRYFNDVDKRNTPSPASALQCSYMREPDVSAQNSFAFLQSLKFGMLVSVSVS